MAIRWLFQLVFLPLFFFFLFSSSFFLSSSFLFSPQSIVSPLFSRTHRNNLSREGSCNQVQIWTGITSLPSSCSSLFFLLLFQPPRSFPPSPSPPTLPSSFILYIVCRIWNKSYSLWEWQIFVEQFLVLTHPWVPLAALLYIWIQVQSKSRKKKKKRERKKKREQEQEEKRV